MKKYGMILFTLIIFIITGVIYYYNDMNLSQIEYKYPKIQLESKKYGVIKNFLWSDTDEDRLIFLAVKEDEKVSSIYSMDINTAEVKNLFTFQTHKILDDFFMYEKWNRYSVFVPSPDGIHEVFIENRSNVEKEFYKINNFEDANSLYIDSKIYYTKPDDNILYTIERTNYSVLDFSRNENSQKQKNYLKSPKEIILDQFGDCLYYTKEERDGISIFKMEEGRPIENRIAKHIIMTKSSFNGHEMIGLKDGKNTYGVFWTDHLWKMDNIDITNETIDRIPKYNDYFNQIPDVQATYDCIVYTKYNKDKKGSIIIRERNSIMNEIIKNKPIVGPIRISELEKNILYFTYEDEKIHVKVYHLNKKKIKDLTEQFL